VKLLDWILKYLPPSMWPQADATQCATNDAYLAELRNRVREEFFAANPRAAIYARHTIARDEQVCELVSAGWVRNGAKRPRVRFLIGTGSDAVFVHLKPALRWPVSS
jgi:hypothetical protein